MKTKILLAAALLTSMPCLADFDFVGKGETKNAQGEASAFSYGFAWNSDKKQFRIGKKTYDMDTLPESYSIAFVLSKDEKNVWVQEFKSDWVESFYWELGNHIIRLEKRNFEQPVMGNYELKIDDRSFFLNNRNIAIKLNFGKDGIDSITASGVTKNMGTKD
ncbi:hypothetical protein AAEU32_03050 [Pseudoalteromonas sp. SSDWG2]|uniref:hypothetical protein n=1 Tax=Pseudoalteromonas sp. SSDWG2 TaxID=3139391 RepID=UPI003BAD4AA3